MFKAKIKDCLSGFDFLSSLKFCYLNKRNIGGNIVLKRIIKTSFLPVALIIISIFLCSCAKSDTQSLSGNSIESNTDDYSSNTDTNDQSTEKEPQDSISITAVMHKDPKFDCADLDISDDDLTDAGINFGDSVNITFENGDYLTDVPYFNGYYVKTGEPVVVAYPGNDYVLIAKNNSDFWTPYELSDGMTVTITLNTPEKYLSTQEALGQSYFIDRDMYSSDEIFANFRELKGGRLKSDFLYRGASPVDNSRNRAAFVNSLLKDHNIACIIDLADSHDDMLSYFDEEDFYSYYAKQLYEEGRTAVLDMSSSYSKDQYKQSVVKGLRKLLEVGGPAYIHCMEGKDRTGFVCMLIEALAGASYDEMRDDYMITYENYYGITKDGSPDCYNAVVSLYFDAFLEYLTDESGVNAISKSDYFEYAKQYLNDGGMSNEEIDELLEMITK